MRSLSCRTYVYLYGGIYDGISQEHVSGQSSLPEHQHLVPKDHTRLKVECDPSTKYIEGVLTRRLTMNWCSCFYFLIISLQIIKIRYSEVLAQSLFILTRQIRPKLTRSMPNIRQFTLHFHGPDRDTASLIMIRMSL